jgi:hypothetical protein
MTPLLMTAVAPKREKDSWRFSGLLLTASTRRAARVGAGAATGWGAGRGFGEERTRVVRGRRRRAERRILEFDVMFFFSLFL